MTRLIVIPARYGSTRFPAKPLAPIAGRTLLERVIDLARRATRSMPDVQIVVATDHDAIRVHAEELGAEAVMTAPDIASGTGRALAAARTLSPAPRVVLNLQGDAPFVPENAISAVLEALERPGVDVATPVIRLDWPALDALREHKRGSPFSGTTCIRAPDGRALWFSKAVLPQIRGEAALRAAGPLSPVYRHLGLYGFALAALEAFEREPVSHYEALEGLEQLRLLEAGMTIQTVAVDAQAIPISGIDTPADAAAAERLIAERGDPFGASA